MNAQKLLLDRIEFVTVKIETVTSGKFKENKVFPQLSFDFSKVNILTRSSLHYADDEVEDPRHVVLSYGLKIDNDQPKGVNVPYLIEIEALGYFRYTGGDEFVGAERFRAIRFSGYQLLYGAIREMAANLTARGRYGLMQLPARTFSVIAKERAEQDEIERQERLQKMSTAKVTVEGEKKKLLKADGKVTGKTVKSTERRKPKKSQESSK